MTVRSGAARAAATGKPFVRVVGSQSGEVVRGRATPLAAIDAVNLSASAATRTGAHDVVTIAVADARGRFAGELPMMRGDVVRIRARSARGALGPWQLIEARLSGHAREVRAAWSRIGICVEAGERLRFVNLSASRTLAAPGIELTFENTRTGHACSAQMNDRGTFARKPTLPGRWGDRVIVRSGARVLGTLTAPAKPSRTPREDRVGLWSYHRKLGVSPELRFISHPLFAGTPRGEHVMQSELPNCYFASACEAIATACPSAIERAIALVGEGTYRVRFWRVTPHGRRARYIRVTSHLYVRPSGELLYGSMGGRRPQLWWPILEKAYARLRGGYRVIGRGGCSDLVLQALLGRKARRFFIEPDRAGEADRVWSALTSALDEMRPIVAGTAPATAAARYRGTGVMPDHAYAVMAYRVRRGVRTLRVRNPWGEDAAPPCVPRTNGVLELSLEAFVRLFYVISTVW